MAISLAGNPKFNSGDKVFFIIKGERSVTYTVLECIGTLGATYYTYRIQSPSGIVTYGTDHDLHLAGKPETVAWITCIAHAARFPEGWEAEHAFGPIALGNGPCALIQYISERPDGN